MGINKKVMDIMGYLKKYRYVVLVLLLGVVFMLIPGIHSNEIKDEIEIQVQEPTISVSQELEQILSFVDGAGKTKVMITYLRGEEVVYQTDVDVSASENQDSEKQKTVLITGKDKGQSGLIARIDPAKCMGVIVLCQGADKPSVRLAVIDAVGKVMGLGADRISVLKMK